MPGSCIEAPRVRSTEPLATGGLLVLGGRCRPAAISDPDWIPPIQNFSPDLSDKGNIGAQSHFPME